MRKTLAALGVVAVLVGGAAIASDRLLGETEFIRKLNGSPTLVGTVATDGGAAANNCTTAGTTFDAGFGDMVVSVCNYDHTMKTTACPTPAAATAASFPIQANEKIYTLLTSTENAISFFPVDAGVIGACRVYHLR